MYTDWKNTFREKREKKLNRKLTKLQKAIAGGIILAAVTGGSFLMQMKHCMLQKNEEKTAIHSIYQKKY